MVLALIKRRRERIDYPHSCSHGHQHYFISRGPDCKLIFRQIFTNAKILSVYISTLISTVAAYFDMNNIITERESEVVASFIRHSILCVDNVTGGGFLNAKEMFISIVNPSNCPSNVSNFTFRSKINPHLVDNRPPDSIHYSKFPLRLPFTTLFPY